jgi:hypothetical protein
VKQGKDDKPASKRTQHSRHGCLALTGKLLIAEGGTRTRTASRPTDFKSVASAIPPPRLLHLEDNMHGRSFQTSSHDRRGVLEWFCHNIMLRRQVEMYE